MSQTITNLGVRFDANTVAPQAAMEAVPAGWYSVIISGGEILLTEQGQGRRMKLEWTVTEGPYKGRKIFDGLNYVHSSQQAQQIAQGQLSAICHSVGQFVLEDISQLFNKPHQIKVKVDPAKCVDADGNEVPVGTPNAKTYEPQNRFQGAKAGSAPAAAVATGAPAPSWAVPAPGAAPAGVPASFAANPAQALTPPAAAPATKGKPGRKPGKPSAAAPAAAPAPVPFVPAGNFYVGIDKPEFANALSGAQVGAMIAQGMPVTTPVCLDGEEAYKAASEYGFGKMVNPVAAPAVAAPAPAFVPPPVAAPAPAAAPAATERPPWET